MNHHHRHVVRPWPPGHGRPHTTTVTTADTVICAVDVLLRFDPAVVDTIEAAHGLRPGMLVDVLADRPSAQVATAGLLPYRPWLAAARRLLPPAAVDRWLAYHGELNQPAANLVLAAQRATGLRLCLAGNATRRLWHDLAHHQLAAAANTVFVSAHIGRLLPDPQFFAYIFDHTTAAPNRTLLVATEPSWLQVATELGLATHRYRGPAQLATALMNTVAPQLSATVRYRQGPA